MQCSTECGALFLRQRRERKPQLLRAQAHLLERRLDGDGIYVGKQRVDQRQTGALQSAGFRKIAAQTAFRNVHGGARPDVGQHGDHALSAEGHRRGDLIVIARPNVKIFSAKCSNVRDLREIPACLLHAVDAWVTAQACAGLGGQIYARARGNVVGNEGQGSRVCNCKIVDSQALLRSLIIIWRDRKKCVCARLLGLLGVAYGLRSVVRSDPCNDLAASGAVGDCMGDQKCPLLRCERRRFACRSADDDSPNVSTLLVWNNPRFL